MSVKHVVVTSGNALHAGSKSCRRECNELNFLSVGSQLPPGPPNVVNIEYLLLID